MKKRLVTLLPYAAVLAVSFYVLPILAKNTGMAMLLMLCVMPVTAFAGSLIWGARYGFDLLLPIMTMAWFVPTIFIFYNGSAWVYAVVYGGLSRAGNGVGRAFYRRR